MQRRKFIKNSAMTGLASTLTASSIFESSDIVEKRAFNLLYAPHFGMFENSAGKDLIDQLQFMHDNGFKAMEDNGMMGRDVATQEKIANKMAKLGMKMGVFVVSYDNWPLSTSLTSGDKTWRDKFIAACKEAVNVAKRVNAKYMTVVPGNFDRSKPLGIQTSNVIEALRRGAEIFEPHKLTMVLEPLSDTPDLFLRYSDQTHMICKAVNSSACKILYDIYHMQKNEGRMVYNISQTWDEIAYFQIGDEPGRKEPTTGEINYKNLFKFIDEKAKMEKKDFIFGMEHGNFYPGKDGEMKLIQAYHEADSFN
jgi:hydroxypyruvate isomerase